MTQRGAPNTETRTSTLLVPVSISLKGNANMAIATSASSDKLMNPPAVLVSREAARAMKAGLGCVSDATCSARQ